MYIIVPLNKMNIYDFKRLNDKRRVVNGLNEDFFSLYEKCNFINKFALRRQVRLLKENNTYIGYIWSVKENNKTSIIRSMVVLESDLLKGYNRLLSTLKYAEDILYTCDDNYATKDILKALGFNIIEGTIEMCLEVDNIKALGNAQNLYFEKMKRGEQEKLRCEIQNNIFDNDNRIPLTIEDIFFDEDQSYYLEDGAVFIKKDDIYLGYGQIVIDMEKAYIVNFGILKEHRGNGYGKYLISHLVFLIKGFGFNRVYIKVDVKNKYAMKLYESMGFNLCGECNIWSKIKNK